MSPELICAAQLAEDASRIVKYRADPPVQLRHIVEFKSVMLLIVG